MRILFSTYTNAFQNPGGGENVMLKLRTGLQAKGHTVEIFEPLTHDPADFDLCHHFSLFERDTWPHLKRNDRPLVVTPTMHLDQKIFGGLRWKLHLATLEVEERALGHPSGTLKLPDLWLPATRREARLLQDYYGLPRERVRLLPNGVDVSYAGGSPELFRNETGITGPFVLHVGRFHPVKNQMALLRAGARSKLPVVFIGGADEDFSDYREACVKLARELEARAGKLFTFLDHQPFESPLLRSAYKAASAFALPSQFETFGISALEALVAGLPLVLTSQVADPEVFPGASFVHPDDEEGLAAALKRAAGGVGKPAAMLVNRMLNTYSWNNITDKLLDLYEGLGRANAAG
ncbi:MAG TPA: glycosyltransferase family 4 protein [Bdellovibrionota bacterium]|jgi:hypothetical protein